MFVIIITNLAYLYFAISILRLVAIFSECIKYVKRSDV